ncbi:serine hydrolase [Saprospiraceae bacterium]|nr:serine hydrolase [Saprospiraceae bacterium]
MQKSTIFLLTILLICFASTRSTTQVAQQDQKMVWVQNTLDSMTLIGQLMMIRAHSDLGEDHIASVKNLISKYKVGSLCFFQGTPLKQAQLTNEYQELSEVPLMVAIDGEWGLGMRFKKGVIDYPKQLTLGSITDNSLLYEMGKTVAYELKRIGIHMNFAPVVDVNNNPLNPVINTRSFGEDRENVSAKSYEYMQGMQDGGLLACAKHFPGHGDTNADSHYDLPVINHSRIRLETLEMYPFKMMIDKGISSVMVAHLHVPAFDNRPNRPTSLSENTIKNILRTDYGFDGLVITDGMEMEGVTKHFDPGVAEAEAILAGNDIICLPRDVPQAIKSIKKYVKLGRIAEGQIDASVRRILESKYDLGLNIKPRIMLNDLETDILHKKGRLLKARLLEESITLAQDSFNIIPYQKLQGIQFATITFGATSKTTFQKRVDSYTKAIHYQVPYNVGEARVKQIISELQEVNHVIIAAHKVRSSASRKYGMSTNFHNIVKRINDKKDLSIVIFGTPYSLKYFDDYSTVVMAHTQDSIMQDKTAQAIFGAIDIRGRLPVTASEKFVFGQGLQRSSIKRLGFATPEEVGMNPDSLAKINEIIEEMIKTKAAPGCQIFVAKNGKVILNQAYGTQDYKKENPVDTEDIYDVASITKIAASTISVMKLYEEGKIDLDGTMTPFITEIDTTNKKDKTVRQMMTHHASLVGWIPFYRKTINPKSKKKKTLEKYYRKLPSDSFNIQVASNLYMRSDYPDTIWQRIITSDLRSKTNYRYSDLGFYFMMAAIEEKSKLSLDKYTMKTFYEPLGLIRTGYNPRDFTNVKDIVPSEKDSYFRNQVIKGYVHDMGAAMLGGVSGHAGLFTNSYELGIIMQMLLNGGYYGGENLLEAKTVVEFTTRYSESTRRGIGFDMKELNLKKYENMSQMASESTFGHLGFTGTCAFVDPEHDLVYVFLSNRTYPTMENKKFINKNYRPRVQSAIYSSFLSKEEIHAANERSKKAK